MGHVAKVMRNFIPFFALLLLSACTPSRTIGSSIETEERDFRCGKNFLREGKRKEALQSFLRCIENYPKKSAEAHFESGEIYLNFYRDPIAAIYHYRQYLLQRPDSKQAPLVRQRIGTAEKAFIEQISALRSSNRDSHQNLLKTIKLLQDENGRLKRKCALLLAQVEGKNGSEAVADGTPKTDGTHCYMEIAQQKRNEGSSRRYAVAKGDTLSGISCKVYGSPNRWQEIFDANRHLLKSPSHLRIGQELIIP